MAPGAGGELGATGNALEPPAESLQTHQPICYLPLPEDQVDCLVPAPQSPWKPPWQVELRKSGPRPRVVAQ